MAKKILVVAFIAFVVFFVANRPLTAATVARSLGSTLAGIASGIGDFLSNLA